MRKRRVLIVEDDPTIAIDLMAVVSDAVDAEILHSRSVSLAKVLLEHTVDFALLDIDVTNGKTFEVAALLRVKHVPFVFLSGSQREDVPAHLADAPFIAKPWNEQALARQIRDMLRDEGE